MRRVTRWRAKQSRFEQRQVDKDLCQAPTKKTTIHVFDGQCTNTYEFLWFWTSVLGHVFHHPHPTRAAAQATASTGCAAAVGAGGQPGTTPPCSGKPEDAMACLDPGWPFSCTPALSSNSRFLAAACLNCSICRRKLSSTALIADTAPAVEAKSSPYSPAE